MLRAEAAELQAALAAAQAARDAAAADRDAVLLRSSEKPPMFLEKSFVMDFIADLRVF